MEDNKEKDAKPVTDQEAPAKKKIVIQLRKLEKIETTTQRDNNH